MKTKTLELEESAGDVANRRLVSKYWLYISGWTLGERIQNENIGSTSRRNPQHLLLQTNVWH